MTMHDNIIIIFQTDEYIQYKYIQYVKQKHL